MPERRHTERGAMHRTGAATAEVNEDGSVSITLKLPESEAKMRFPEQVTIEMVEAIGQVIRYEFSGQEMH